MRVSHTIQYFPMVCPTKTANALSNTNLSYLEHNPPSKAFRNALASSPHLEVQPSSFHVTEAPVNDKLETRSIA